MTVNRTQGAKLVAYYRLSKDSRSGENLGRDAQESAVQRLAEQINATIAASYEEVESGAIAGRVELKRALVHCRRIKGILCVAKLDRGSRSFLQLAQLLEGDVPVICADMPQADKNMLRVRAVFAAWELDTISQRIKDALKIAKAKGKLLGSKRKDWAEKHHLDRLRGLAKGRITAVKVLKQQAAEAYLDILPEIQEYRAQGKSFQAIADVLNQNGVISRRGGKWGPSQVMRVLKRSLSIP